MWGRKIAENDKAAQNPVPNINLPVPGMAMKKAAAWLAAVLCAAFLLSGCGAKPPSDTLRWINASYAILTALNDNDYTVYGGMEVNEQNQKSQVAALDEWWGVSDRASADEVLAWVLEKGHRVSFVEDTAFLEQSAVMDGVPRASYVATILEAFEVDEAQARFMADTYAMYQDYGKGAIDAWDYCRALNLLSFYYVAGYYEREEALDKSLEIAGRLQAMYSSWDELADSYLRGYAYWTGESSEERRAVYEKLKIREDSPYAVDYNVTLEKSW